MRKIGFSKLKKLNICYDLKLGSSDKQTNIDRNYSSTQYSNTTRDHTDATLILGIDPDTKSFAST